MLKWTKHRFKGDIDEAKSDNQSLHSFESRERGDIQSEEGIFIRPYNSLPNLRQLSLKSSHAGQISSNNKESFQNCDTSNNEDNPTLKLLRFSGSWYTRAKTEKPFKEKKKAITASIDAFETLKESDLPTTHRDSVSDTKSSQVSTVSDHFSAVNNISPSQGPVHRLTTSDTRPKPNNLVGTQTSTSEHSFPSPSLFRGPAVLLQNLNRTSNPSLSNMASSTLPDLTPQSNQNSEILGPEIEWEEKGLTLTQITEKDSFPCICCYEEQGKETDGRWEFLSAGLKIYSRQPVLFHSYCKKKQARARTIHKDKGGAYYELGQTMLIPDDYQGWFELVPSDFSRASCFTSIADVAKAMPARFFTRSNVRGIRIEGEGDQQKFLERKIPAGSVLQTKGTYTAKWKTVAETGMFKKKTTQWEFQEVTYLKCVDKDESELLVPLHHRGKFNSIYERGNSAMTQNAVYSMKDILSELSLPVKVRLLFGKAPVVPCIFTGMLVIRDACVDETIIGSTVLNTRNVLFEIPLNSPVTVRYVSTDEALEELSTYNDAKKLCRKYAHLFSTMIKLSPDLDTDQKVIQHVPSDPSVMREADEALRALDLITDISLTGEPKDHLLDTDSASGESDMSIVPKGGTMSELTEYKSRESHTHV